MEKLEEIGFIAIGTDFCINVSYLLGIDYVTFGSLFFGFFMNGVIAILILLNIYVSLKKSLTVVNNLLVSSLRISD